MNRHPHSTPQSQSQLRESFPLLFAVVLFAVVGCAEPRGTVSGKVTYKDKAVKGGMVVFVSEDLKQENVPINADGTYSSSKVPLGEKVKVGVEPAPKSMQNLMASKGGKKPTNMPEGGPTGVYGGGSTDGKEYVDIPQVLRDPATSKIFTKVERGEQTFNITLKDPN